MTDNEHSEDAVT